MSERIEQAKATLTSARQRLENVLDAVGNRWDTQVYSDGAGWTVKQLAIHLADADRGQSVLAKNIAQGGEGVPADFDLERYNRRSVEKRAEMTVEEARASLAATRADLFSWLGSVDDAILDKQGRHASLRILSIQELLETMADHERGHADDIARALKLGGYS